jgi:hypothetical protein
LLNLSAEDAMKLMPLLLATYLIGCGGSQQTVRPDETSAEGHRQQAKREGDLAHQETNAYSPAASRPSPFRDPIAQKDSDYLYSVPVYNPTEGHLREADKHRQHARQHEAAAQYLERYEQAECKDFPPATRAACPLLGPALSIDDIPGGVRVRLTQATRVDAVVAHMRCHFAYAQSRGFDAVAGCPLYMRGIDIRRGADPLTIEITSADPSAAREIRARSREEAVFVRGGKP